MKKKIILLIEDDELDVMSVRRSLKKLDIPYEFYTAFDGDEALKLLTGTDDGPALVSPDIILLDLNMPRMNGIEFLTVLRNDLCLKSARVYILTTSGDITGRVEMERLGISGYLIKPMGYGGGYNRVESMEHFVQFHLRKILTDIEAG